MNYLNDLNTQQKEAVLQTEGPLLIVAGAGAGKTKTLTYRILYLIHKGILPHNILAVTFTNKAANEMRERTIKLLDGKDYGSLPLIVTFHGLGVRILKENSELVGISKYFSIADDGDTISIIKEALKKLDLDPKQYEPRKIRSVISRLKGDFVSHEDFSLKIQSSFEEVVLKVWKIYDESLKNEGSLDFDDLLLKSVQLLKKHPEIKKEYNKRFEYIHIDEYQDTNEVQYELVKLLVSEKENICVVGDTDQNIYSWRGANIKNMLHFEKDYPKAKIIMLEQNYRSTKNIIEAANTIIKKNQYRADKHLFTENEIGEAISLYEAFDEYAEGKFIANKVSNLLNEGVKPENIAVLYRANFQSRVLEESFIRQGLPYQVLGVKFFERKEVKDVLAYLRASRNKEGLSDIKRIINVPTRGIGKTTIIKLFSGMKDSLPQAMKIKIDNFYNLLNEIEEYSHTNSVSETIKFIIKKSGIENELKTNGTEEDLERLSNIQELVSLSLKYDELDEEGVDALLTDASLASDQDSLMHKTEKTNGVRLMTVHASKGLEFKYVFIAGLEQDLFPQSRDTKKDGDPEEERRLFYVALTRAEHKLFLSYTSFRTIFGARCVNTPSEFLSDIPDYLMMLETGGGNEDKIVYI